MITVEQALSDLFDLIAPLGTENVPLAKAHKRVLATPAVAHRDQPPFTASMMDGYAICDQDAATTGALRVIGEAAAGHRYSGEISTGQCVRIFTGAPVPPGADRVIIQEDVVRDGDTIRLNPNRDTARYIRAGGADFQRGSTLSAPRVLRANDLALLAAMNVAQVEVFKQPRVALLATGDELVMPGETPGPDQIIASNAYGLMALANAAGATTQILPIARDNVASLEMAFSLGADADLLVTIGGASVGDHDLVAPVAASLGMKQAFYKILMRPGKPLMAGTLGQSVMLGLPGNPVSSMVCGHIFMLPALQKLQGLPGEAAPRHRAHLGVDLPPNGAREHYLRARVSGGEITPHDRQDSALLGVLAQSNALLVRPIGDPARQKGDMVDYIAI